MDIGELGPCCVQQSFQGFVDFILQPYIATKYTIQQIIDDAAKTCTIEMLQKNFLNLEL